MSSTFPIIIKWPFATVYVYEDHTHIQYKNVNLFDGITPTPTLTSTRNRRASIVHDGRLFQYFDSYIHKRDSDAKTYVHKNRSNTLT